MFNQWAFILMLCLLRTFKKKIFYGFLKVRSQAQITGKMEGGSCSVTSSVMDVGFFGHNLAW